MTGEQHTKIIQAIQQNVGDVALISQKLAELSEDYSTTLATVDTSTKEVEKFKLENEKLRQANMNLFMKIGTTKEDEETEEEEEENTLTFDALFNEKGELK